MSLEELIKTVSVHTGVSVSAMKSRKKDRKTSCARQIFMYLSKHTLGSTIYDTARFLRCSPQNVSFQTASVEQDIKIRYWVRNAIDGINNELKKGVKSQST